VLVVLVAMVLVLASGLVVVVALAGSVMGQVALDQVASVMDLAQGAHSCKHHFHCTS
jgi:hypothetical protein